MQRILALYVIRTLYIFLRLNIHICNLLLSERNYRVKRREMGSGNDAEKIWDGRKYSISILFLFLFSQETLQPFTKWLHSLMKLWVKALTFSFSLTSYYFLHKVCEQMHSFLGECKRFPQETNALKYVFLVDNKIQVMSKRSYLRVERTRTTPQSCNYDLNQFQFVRVWIKLFYRIEFSFTLMHNFHRQIQLS